jgi:hypothetical protein
MSKIAFKNPKGNTIYWAKVGFDWGAFWGFFILGGLPFFLRKMNVWGAYCLGIALIDTVGLVSVRSDNLWSETWFVIVLTLGIGIYLGLKGGKLTARHYLEEGYEFHTKDKELLGLAKKKWGLNV